MRRQQQDEDIRNNLLRLGLRPVQRAPSVESDEDDDPEPQTSNPAPGTQMPDVVSESEESAIHSPSQMPNVVSHPNPSKNSYDHVETQEEHEPPPKKRKLDTSDDNSSNNAYTIQEATNKDGEEVIQSELGSYPNIKDATWAFRKLRTKYKKRKIQAFTESEDNECLSCTIFYENDDAPYQQTIWLEPKPPRNSKDPKFVASRHIYHKHYDLMVGEESIQDTVTTEGTFTSRLMANKFAHDGFCAYLKPKVPNLDHITLWKDHCKQVTAYKENLDRADGVFEVEIETGDTPWLDVDGFSFVVEMK